jgi:hypothetical protein
MTADISGKAHVAGSGTDVSAAILARYPGTHLS